jgi:hypothetical protein
MRTMKQEKSKTTEVPRGQHSIDEVEGKRIKRERTRISVSTGALYNGSAE